MLTMSAAELCDRVRYVRQAVARGKKVALTYYRKPYGIVVSPEKIEQMEAEIERLRARVAELEGAAS